MRILILEPVGLDQQIAGPAGSALRRASRGSHDDPETEWTKRDVSLDVFFRDFQKLKRMVRHAFLPSSPCVNRNLLPGQPQVPREEFCG